MEDKEDGVANLFLHQIIDLAPAAAPAQPGLWLHISPLNPLRHTVAVAVS